MIHNPNAFQSIPLGVVLQRRPGVTRWAPWSWRAVAVLPGAGQADWAELRSEGDVTEFHAQTLSLELHGAETEAYLHGLSAEVPSVYVVMRAAVDAKDDDKRALDLLLVTASPYEAQDYTENGEDIVEKVPMPHGLVAWVRDFVEAFHEDEVFVKRKRDKKNIDLVQDGIGDPRIATTSDVYASPGLKRGRLQ